MAKKPETESFMDMFTRFGQDLKMPQVDIEKIMSQGRKNLEALEKSAKASAASVSAARRLLSAPATSGRNAGGRAVAASHRVERPVVRGTRPVSQPCSTSAYRSLLLRKISAVRALVRRQFQGMNATVVQNACSIIAERTRSNCMNP